MGESHTAVTTGKADLAVQAIGKMVASVPCRGMPMGVGTIRLSKRAQLFLTGEIGFGNTMGIESPVGMRRSHLGVSNILRNATPRHGCWMTGAVGTAVIFVGGLRLHQQA